MVERQTQHSGVTIVARKERGLYLESIILNFAMLINHCLVKKSFQEKPLVCYAWFAHERIT